VNAQYAPEAVVTIDKGTYPGQPSPLCLGFRERANVTWDLITVGESSRIRPAEETLTEVNLLELQVRYPSQIRCWMFSKHAEGRTTGADWEWWIGARGGWVGVRVQAKRLALPSRSYEKLDHSSGSVRQVDRLIGDASGMYPIYCFYNAFDRLGHDVPWNCGTISVDDKQLGCAVAGAPAIKSFIDSGVKDLMSVLTVSRPWACIVCCTGYGGVTLAERAALVLTALVDDGLDRPIQVNLPYHVRALIAGERVEQPDVSGVAVMTDQSIEEAF
jgi:hypothetical protein